MSAPGAALAARLRERDLSAAPATLNLLESTTPADREQAAALLEELSPAATGAEARGQLVGVTGPPGAGKSTLLSCLVRAWRARNQSVAVLAVDPSSRRSGGSLLGDRARIDADPHDRHIMIRSTAAGERLGGLAPTTAVAAHALAVAFDVVVIETVGVGQAETDVASVVDTVVLVVQPGSGDTLQFLKAGIMEVPDLLVVTKADLGEVALRTTADLQAAVGTLLADRHSSQPEILAVSSLPPPSHIDELADAIQRRAQEGHNHRARARRASALLEFVHEHGERGLRALGGRQAAERVLAAQDPGAGVPSMVATLEREAHP